MDTESSPDLLKLKQSLMVALQRRELMQLADSLGTQILFLKAAWADPVLYGGRGERYGADLDALVPENAFARFTTALKSAGYKRRVIPTHPVMSLSYREAAFLAAPPKVTIDLHDALGCWPWYELPTSDCFDRAIAYPSVDGPIWSLSPEDQVLYAALHYANHAMQLDDRHMEDVIRLLERFPIDWTLLEKRATTGGFLLPLAWVFEQLQHRLNVPNVPISLTTQAKVRLFFAKLSRQRILFSSRRFSHCRDIVIRTLLSSRTLALPRFMVRYIHFRMADMAVLTGLKKAPIP